MFSNNEEVKTEIKTNLMSSFKMKDLGEAHEVLGMRITRDRKRGKICIDQELYINEILEKFNMADCNPVSTPIDINQKLSKEQCPKNQKEQDEMKAIPYQEAVGSIMFTAQVCRPDVSFAVNMVSRFSKNPGRVHWAAVKRILRYLKGTANMKLEYSKDGNSDILGYCDADWASDLDERKSTTGYVFNLQGGAISWNSKKQQTVALSTTEAEYMSLSATTQEALWLKSLNNELEPKVIDGIQMYCDNKGAINLASDNIYHFRTKHIDVRHHFLRNHIKDGRIILQYLESNSMIADVMTKAVPYPKHQFCISRMGLGA